MTAADPAATLQQLADHYRANAGVNQYHDPEMAAWADHVEGVAQRHREYTGLPQPNGECHRCIKQPYPCADIESLLAVAAAAGVKR